MKAAINIVFLDIDGVLNSEQFYKETDSFVWDMFNPSSVKLLNKLTDAADAKIIISSDWRKNHTLPELQKIFKDNEIKAEIIGITPKLKCKSTFVSIPRGLEIKEKLLWLISDNPDESINYVIIDDDDFGILLSQRNHFVQTDLQYGFSMIDFEKSCNILL